MTQPLFNGTAEALMFAYRFSSQQYALSPVAKMMKSGVIGSGRGLGNLDGAAQAGMIRAAVAKLSKIEQACLVARYSLRYEPCPCCGGEKAIQEYAESVITLIDWTLAVVPEQTQRDVREQIVRAYFEKGVNLSNEFERRKLPRSTGFDRKKKIWDALKTLETRAQDWASDMLEGLFAQQQ